MKRTSILAILTVALVLVFALGASAQTVNCSGVAAWSPNSVSYSVGQLVTYNGSEYKCIQAHTSQAGWDPADVPALWSLVGTCGTSSTPTPTVAPTATATATVKPTATVTPTSTPNVLPTPTPTVNPTATATATVKPTATATATVKPTATATATAAPTATASGGTACWPAWSSSTAYNGGAQVSYAGENYQAAFWSQGSVPSTNSGAAGSGQPWIPEGACGGSGGGATPTPTQSSGGATPTPTGTPIPTSTPASGNGGSVTCTAPQWSASATYQGGNQVQYNGFLWQAAYYTQNNVPSTAALGGVWAIQGICGALPGPAAGRMAAPYVDVTGGLFSQAMSQAPSKFITLAFVVSDGTCQASWAGESSLNIPASGTPPLATDIANLRAKGGDIIVSFGGAAGTELAGSCGSASALQTQYQNVINQYHAKYIDFDLENGSGGDTMREQVIAALQAANPGLVVSYTLATEPDGLGSLAPTILSDAQAAGVNIGVVNLMAMDFGGAYDNGGNMGLDAQLSGWVAEAYLTTMYPSRSRTQIAAMVGVTPMIGSNDNQAEIFQLADGNTLVNTALSNGWGRLAFWSVTRDQDCLNAGFTTVDPSPASGACSGVSQSTFQYSSEFNAFNP